MYLNKVAPGKESILLKRNEQFDFDIRCITTKSNLKMIHTLGLAKNLQSVNETNLGLERIELYFLLPDYWDMSKNRWPIDWLNRIAEVPQKNKTWFGIGDTLPAGNPPEFIDEKLKASYFILSKPILLKEELVNPDPSERTDETIVQFLAVIPIFRKEFDFKTQNSAHLLFAKMKEKGCSELVDVFRQPLARKKFMGLF